MTNILFSNNNFLEYNLEYNILFWGGIILGCTLLYLIKSNYTVIPIKNKEALTNQEIEEIINENADALTVISNENIDAITDNDFDTDVSTLSTYDNESLFDSATSSDWEDLLREVDISVLPYVKCSNSEPFIMPDVDFNVCSIEELKLFEISSIFSKEIAEHSVSEEDLMELISIFSKEDLATN
jgi:hypothetical protein